jgi:hypothetical protein
LIEITSIRATIWSRLSHQVASTSASCSGRRRHGGADPAHADDAEPPAAHPAADEGHRRPALPAARLHHREPLGDAAGDRKDQRHRHVGGVLGHHARRVRDEDATLAGAGHVDMVHPGAVVGDELQLFARLRQQIGVDLLGQAGDEHVGPPHRGGKLLARHPAVGIAQFHVEKLPHPGLDDRRQASRHDNTQALRSHRTGLLSSKGRFLLANYGPKQGGDKPRKAQPAPMAAETGIA